MISSFAMINVRNSSSRRVYDKYSNFLATSGWRDDTLPPTVDVLESRVQSNGWRDAGLFTAVVFGSTNAMSVQLLIGLKDYNEPNTVTSGHFVSQV